MATVVGLIIKDKDISKEPTIAEIKTKLKELKIEFDDKAKKAELLNLLPKEE